MICSALDFNGVSWPHNYSAKDEVAFSLGINITGSYEGHAGWGNLSNNFDGQGVSMGILNQNLGQGTLQPLLIAMRDQHFSVLEQHFDSTQLKSLLGMLATWEKENPPSALNSMAVENLELVRERVLLDDPQVDKTYAVMNIQTLGNSSSVKWAKKTLYSDSRGRKFKPQWKTALKDLAQDPVYVSLQIEAAQYIHRRALEYKQRLGWTKLRSYLFLFDIVVQNGSLKDKHFIAFDRWHTERGPFSEEQQMLEMLDIRVKDVNPKWRDDVLRRKKTIILGTGFVHGEDRNLPVEYCYDPLLNYR